MSTKIGHFEILSELAKSPAATVYKANDSEGGQTVALKAIELSAFGENAAALERALMEEVESTKVLSCQNITPMFGAGEMEGKFCAAMEYVQGNSIATMLSRKEGFSIWDLLDIGRQLCSALDHAASHRVVHYSLEPAKIMCGWDGTVKILGFGVSSAGKFAQHLPEISTPVYYMPPEQIEDQPMDARSNLFSLGAILYEMVTERKAFDREDIAGLRQSILESTPVAPVHVNPKVHPLLSDLIMKALDKDPAQRYQSGRELLDDLEKCKESKPLAAKKPVAAPATGPQSKPAGQGAAKPASSTAAGARPSAAAAPAGLAKPASASSSASPVSGSTGLAKPSSLAAPSSRAATPAPSEKRADSTQASATAVRPSTLAKPASKLAAPKAAAAAAGATTGSTPVSSEEVDLDLSNQFITPSVSATPGASQTPAAEMSALMDEPEIETFESPVAKSAPAPKIAVDPIMAEGAAASTGTSFSEIAELPPLKEVYIPPPPPPPSPVSYVPQAAPVAPTVFQGTLRRDEKPKVQPREVAEKAIQEIKGVPPKLMLYAIGGAVALILVIGIGVTFYIHSQNGDDDSASGRATSVAETPAQPAGQPVSKAAPAPAAARPAPRASEAEPQEVQAVANMRSRSARKKATPPPAPVTVPGQLTVDSTPQGAQVQLDGRNDATWVTPFTLSNLQPGQHSVTVSKPGYSADTRTVYVTSGNLATIVTHLAQLMATLVVNSDPAGANIYVDGRDMGSKTPAQISVDKGSHVVLVRKMGYIDETMNAQFVLGQTFNFSPTLRPLGNVDDIRTVGKMSRLLGGKGALPGQAIVTIHTQPKGAQVSVNQHIMDKNSPLDVALDPGNYVIDITMTGYAPVHKVVTVDKGSKVVVDETLERQ
jgi:eukaryotic-like serine/threonine-protein kinase